MHALIALSLIASLSGPVSAPDLSAPSSSCTSARFSASSQGDLTLVKAQVGAECPGRRSGTASLVVGGRVIAQVSFTSFPVTLAGWVGSSELPAPACVTIEERRRSSQECIELQSSSQPSSLPAPQVLDRS